MKFSGFIFDNFPIMKDLKRPYSLKISIKSFLIVFFILLPAINNLVVSQIVLNSYAEIGSNAMSQGIYGNYSAQISAQKGSFSASTGALFSLSNATDQVFSAYSFQIGNDFKFRNLPVNIGAFFLWKPISNEMRETNFGLLADYRIQHWGIKLGANTRFYSFTQAAIKQYNFADSIHTSFWEPINLMYKISYFHDFNPKFNLEASITNYDRYFIQQETNPMILLNLNYKVNNGLQFYSELGYMQAGLLNLHVNYFGVYLRGGVIWKIN